jgi:exopolyphosphatase/guanosine-5'-triphosphate,3'-diphosphate pyrophosphatase
MRVAAIDCGTNSIRLLVAAIDVDRKGNRLTDVDRRMEIVRLGEGVDRTGRLAPEALDRTIEALRRYAAVVIASGVAESGVSAVRMVATSATRDAANSAEFTQRVKEVLGVAPEVLTGEEEARLSFLGAVTELTAEPSFSPPFFVTDVGGGSTEFVLGTRSGPRGAISVDIGCVRMTERHLHSDPPSSAEIAAAVADIDAALEKVALAVPVTEARTLVGLAGSVTTVAGIALGLGAYDAARIHHAVIPAAQVHEVTADLLRQTRAERSQIGLMHPGRVDVIAGGALVLDRIMTRFNFPQVLVSEHDILDGIAFEVAHP